MDGNYGIRKGRRRRRLMDLVLAGGLLLSSGCGAAVARKTAVVEPPVTPVTWNAEMKEGLSTNQSGLDTLAKWWTVLDDPVLTRLIEKGIDGNVDLRQAEARVREARARRGGAQADRMPTLQFSPSASGSSRAESSNSLFALGFDASWEADLFGAKRKAAQAADLTMQASIEDLRDILVSLVAEIALNYMEVRTFQVRLDNATDNVKFQEETYDIARWRFEAGLTTQLDVEQARQNLEQTRASIPSLRAGLEQAKNRIAVLIGQEPGTVGNELGEGEIPVTPVELAVGIPADTLRRRPDVRRAERQLAAQTAQVGAAKAERFPRLSLVGSIGLEALSIGNLLSTGARLLTAGLNIGQTAFDAGRIGNNIEVQNALQQQALLTYRSSVLTALEDVEGALVDYAEEQARRRSLMQATEAAQRAAELASTQYQGGLIDFQAVLDSQRSLLSLEDQLASSTGTIASNLVRVYKALGGGWDK
ncbi:MAG: efflux transporter outer membrane subunit [Acidobacteriota bacterium]